MFGFLKPRKQAKTPYTATRYELFADMLKQPHLLIAGATGSGKSVIVNDLIYTAMIDGQSRFVLIDPKRVELVRYKRISQTIRYASEPDDMIKALHEAMAIVEARYRAMAKAGVRKSSDRQVYVIIDELADLMTTSRKEVQPLLQRLCQVGRAAGVHVIACTQCPLATVIPTPIKVNFDARIGLRTRCRQDSRNILDMTGCETLPRYGQAFYMTPEGTDKWNIPMIPDDKLDEAVEYWS